MPKIKKQTAISPELLAELKRQLLAEILGEKAAAEPSDEKDKKRARKKVARIKYFTQDEVEAFFRAIEKEIRTAAPDSQKLKLAVRNHAMLRLVYHRGLRASEVNPIQLADWERDRDALFFNRLKGSKGGTYHLTSREVRALKAWVKLRGTEPGPLFPTREGGGISQQMLDVMVKRYGAAAGLPRDRCHMHAFKHSCATHLLDKGLTLEDVQYWLGHMDIKSTQVYAQYTKNRQVKVDQRLREW